jgi:polysaccharide biosynthesis/export protein
MPFNERTSLFAQTLKLRTILVLGICVACLSISAQAQEKQADTSSDLARQNLNFVAASAMQIKAILLEDPGLMVALKAWVAQDATDHGQMLNEADLTDGAIYDRLEVDVEFRSMATRLVQRFGYLVPQLDPNSQQGQQQALVMQERAKLIAQQNLLETGQSQNGTSQIPPALQTACVQQPVQCAAAAQMAPANSPAAPASPSGNQPVQSIPQIAVPSQPAQPVAPGENPAPGSLERASYSQTAGPSFSDLATLGLFTAPTLPSGGTESQPAGQSSLAQLLGNPSSPASAGSPDALLAAEFTSFNDPTAAAGNSSASSTRAPGGNEALATPRGEQFYNPGAPQPTLVAAANPYKDIPSLYDMYLQSVPQPATPTRFGFEVFQNGIRDPQSVPMDLPVGPDYVVGPGDGLAIDLWGGVSERLYTTVDREGRVSLPEVGPVLVSGKTLADVQENVQQVLRSEFRDISVDVSLSKLRTVRVYEVGDIARPGAYDISSLSTPLNALFAAGGPTSRGSMRLVRHYRGDQLIEEVDLYDLLLRGVKSGLERLESGDTVLVPPIGPQVTVEGMVRRPAIYELKNEKSLADVLELAGGMLPAATLRHIEVQRLVAHEKQTMLSLDIPEGDGDADVTQKLTSFEIQDGDRIRIYPIAAYNQDAVYLEGHVMRPGRYSYRQNMRVGDLIGSYKDLLPEPASQYAEIIRLSAPDFHPVVQSFDLGAAMANPSTSPLLQPMDTLRIFSRFDFENPPAVSVWGDVRKPGTFETAGQIRLADAVHLAGGLSPDARTEDAQVFRALPNGEFKIFSVNLGEALDGDPTANIQLQSRDRVLIHGNPDASQPASVYVEGEVGRPGRYPLTNNMTVADLIMVGGGLKASADAKTAELTTYEFTDAKPGQAPLTTEHREIAISAALARDPAENPPLHNGDVVTIRQIAGWNDIGSSITVKGQVAHPGTYGIRPGERLSSILARAGGFEHDAYPYGAILERVEVRELESKQQDELVVRLKNEGAQLEALPENTDQQKQTKGTAMQQYQTVLTQLGASTPVGRVAIRISADVKDWKGTSADIQVRAGDVLVIPKRPDFVMVTGQVFDSTAISYRPGRSAKWYLSQSGGPTNLADKKDIFVLRANGSVIGSRGHMWSGDPMDATLEPGDTIVVPEKAAGGGAQWTNLFTSAQVASSVVSTVFIALHY